MNFVFLGSVYIAQEAHNDSKVIRLYLFSERSLSLVLFVFRSTFTPRKNP